MNIGNALEMQPNGTNPGPTVVDVDRSFKSFLFDNGKDCDEQVGHHFVANEEAIKILVENVASFKRFGKDGRYTTGVAFARRVLKSHILSQYGIEQANVALLDVPLNLCDALRSKDASKWEATMQEYYNSLMMHAK